MGYAIAVEIDGRTKSVDGRDVQDWVRIGGTPDGSNDTWIHYAEDYVEAHPRPTGSLPALQRFAMLRKLAAGPATRDELLAAMRAVGWVGASDLENRVRELGTKGARGGTDQEGVPVERVGEQYRLAEPFPLLSVVEQRALGFGRALLAGTPGPLARQAVAALDGLVPGIASRNRQVTRSLRASAATYAALHSAMDPPAVVSVRYHSLNSSKASDYRVVPLQYAQGDGAVKTIVADLGDDGLPRRQVQFAMERILAVTLLPDVAVPARDLLEVQTEAIDLTVTTSLFEVMCDRSLFDVEREAAQQLDLDLWRVRGRFPAALGWDVLEQLCGWAGSAQVREPLWLVNAVMRRLRRGLRAMELGEDLTVVKPEPDRVFTSLGHALEWEPDEDPAPRAGAKKLAPRRR